MKKTLFINAGISLVLFIFAIIIGETFDFNFITSAFMISISGIFFLLFVLCLCLIWSISTKGKIIKIIPIFFTVVFLISTFYAVVQTFNLYHDKGSYEAENFDITEGKPDEISFNKHNYLDKLVVNKVELDVTMLDMTKKEYIEKYGEEEITVTYLPKTKIIVEIIKADE